MSDFSGAQVGDKVWSFTEGWGTIIKIDDDSYPIITDDGMFYTVEGKSHKGAILPSLFWDEIKFDIPPKPKRKVKKILSGWLNIYPDGTIRGNIYPNELQADEAASLYDRIACIEINQEYEVEE